VRASAERRPSQDSEYRGVGARGQAGRWCGLGLGYLQGRLVSTPKEVDRYILDAVVGECDLTR
jgi:hypothetical protein